MNRISATALSIVSSAALTAFLLHPPTPNRVFAAAQVQSLQQQPLQSSQSKSQSSAGQGQQSNKGVTLTGTPVPLTPIQALQLQTAGLQMEVQSLQTQLRTDENTIHSLQSSLQTLQTQFINHSHKTSVIWPNRNQCTFLNQYLVTQAGDGKQVRLGLWAERSQPCHSPAWTQEQLQMSTPVQGAQTDQIVGTGPTQ